MCIARDASFLMRRDENVIAWCGWFCHSKGGNGIYSNEETDYHVQVSIWYNCPVYSMPGLL